MDTTTVTITFNNVPTEMLTTIFNRFKQYAITQVNEVVTVSETMKFDFAYLHQHNLMPAFIDCVAAAIAIQGTISSKENLN
jgi:hypothetical protein